jgi:hypothetical protein
MLRANAEEVQNPRTPAPGERPKAGVQNIGNSSKAEGLAIDVIVL